MNVNVSLCFSNLAMGALSVERQILNQTPIPHLTSNYLFSRYLESSHYIFCKVSELYRAFSACYSDRGFRAAHKWEHYIIHDGKTYNSSHFKKVFDESKLIKRSVIFTHGGVEVRGLQFWYRRRLLLRNHVVVHHRRIKRLITHKPWNLHLFLYSG